MPQNCFAQFDPAATNGGQFGTNPATGNVVFRLDAIFQNTDAVPVRTERINEIQCEIPTGSTLNQVRDLMVTALVNEGTNRGFTIPRGRVVIPSFQVGL